MLLATSLVSNSFVEYTVIGVYLLLLVIVGLAVRRMSHNVSDYFRGGCRATWWLVGMGAFMSSFSAWTFTGAAGVAFTSGWSAIFIYLSGAIGFFLGFLFLAPWFRQLRAITAPEVIRMRYGVRTQQFYAWVQVVAGLLYSALYLYGLSIFTSSVFGFDIQIVIIFVGIVVLVYVTTGGSWAVMTNDFLQGLILVPITLLVAYLSLKAVGGIDGLFNMIQQKNLSTDLKWVHDEGRFPNNEFTWNWVTAIVIGNVIGYSTLISGVRYFSAKDGRDARKAALLAGIMMLVGAFVWMIPPIVARVIYADDVNGMQIAKPAEAAYAVISMKLLPVGLSGMVIVAMFAATISSMDAGMNRNAAVITQDIYPTLCSLIGRHPCDDKKRLLMGKIVTFVMGLFIIILAEYFAGQGGKGVFGFMMDIGAMIAAPMAVPMLLCLFIRRAPGWSAIFSAVCGLIPSAMGFYSEHLFGHKWNYQTQIFINLTVGSIAFLITLPFWKYSTEAYHQQVKDFFRRMHTPIDFAKEVGKPNDLHQLKIVGTFSSIVGLFLFCLLLLPNTWQGRMAIIGVAGFVLIVGLLLLTVAIKRQRNENVLTIQNVIEQKEAIE